MEEIAIYLHWPFCKSKCPYCDFASIRQNDASLYEKFEDLLLLDLTRSISEIGDRRIKSVFFGGGTPSLMNPKSIEKILNFLIKKFSMTNEAEITLEANPDTFCRNKMKDFKNAGINRASLGVQSFFDKNLRFLSRSYGEKQSVAAAEIVAQTFENFSFDFIYGYEGQTVKNFAQDLERAVNFECKHISCYQLTFEENTPFYEKMLAGVIKKIDENKEIELYDYIEDFLENNNIFRYEISNYSMAGFESRHNLAYWKYEDYLGVGPSAHSRVVVDKRKTEMVKISDPFLWESALSQNRSTFSHINTLSEKEKLEEMIIMGLRMVNGVTMEDLYQKVSPRVVNEIISEKKLKFLTEKKLMANGKIQLTKSGLKKMNSAVKFLLS